MNFNGKKVTMDCFVFSEAVDRKEDLYDWSGWFKKRGIYCFIRYRIDGRYDLVREGKEANADVPGEPIIGPCKYCGNDPPHAFGNYKYCNADCMANDFMRRKYGCV